MEYSCFRLSFLWPVGWVWPWQLWGWDDHYARFLQQVSGAWGRETEWILQKGTWSRGIMGLKAQGCCCWWLVVKSCRTLCNPRDCSLPGSSVSSVHGILQARILEWVSISYSWGSSDSGIKPTCMAGKFFTIEPPGKPTVISLHII